MAKISTLLYALFAAGYRATESDSLDCWITIKEPYDASTSIGGIEPNLDLEVGSGPISRAIRSEPHSFLVCLEWDALNVSRSDLSSAASCTPLAGDGASGLPAFDASQLQDGFHRFRASVHRRHSLVGNIPGVQIIASESNYFTKNRQEESNPGWKTTVPAVQMPCNWSGSLSAVVPWSTAFSSGPTPPIALAGFTVDVPIDLSQVSSWVAVEASLRPQFHSICSGNHPAGRRIEVGWNPESCANDMMRQVLEWSRARCLGEHGNRGNDLEREKESLESFKSFVAETLSLPSTWSMTDIDAKFFKSKSPIGIDSSRDDSCTSLLAPFYETMAALSNFSTVELPKVFIVGAFATKQFVRRQRDFVLRDILGCLPSARVCVDDVEDAERVREECQDMLRYAMSRRRESHSSAWECGSCSEIVPHPGITLSVLVSSLNYLDKPPYAGDDHDWKLRRKWSPSVIIHLNDEIPMPEHLRRRFYRGSHLVLRMYGLPQTSKESHGGEHEKGNNFPRDDGPRIVVIPVGYLCGFSDSTEGEDVSFGTARRHQENFPYRSGLEAVRELALKTSMHRNLRWSFVGTRGMHHPHTSDARTAMTSFLSGIGGDHIAYFTERDGYTS